MHPFEKRLNRLLASALAGAALFTSIGAGPAGAQVVRIPGDASGAPAYARIEQPFLYHTDEWAAIVFYRWPDCVRTDFNLLTLQDVRPDGTVDPRVFACPLTVSGFEVWDRSLDVVAPRQVVISGPAVPVWFVPWTTFQAAIADGALTISELESLSPLKGVATSFHEVLHPWVPPGTPGGAKMSVLTVTASGVLSDGRWFQYEFAGVGFSDPKNVHVRIVFR